MHQDFELRTIETNGISVRAAVAGEGPLVVMVHGWPELWYSWRHQIKAVAAAGYRVVAPDVRGYGGSDKPHAVEAYDMVNMMGDVTGLIDAFGEDTAVLVGHDWGAPICWNTAALRPERVSAVACLSVPYFKRGAISSMELWRKLYEGKFFYQLYFQKEGVAEAELEADVRTALRKIYFSISGDLPRGENRMQGSPDGTLLEAMTDPKTLPGWMSADDLDYFVENFEAGGFRGPINRYRNQDRDFNDLPELGARPVAQPSCFIAGSRDPVRHFIPGHDLYQTPDANCTDLRFTKLIDGIGHWVQQEAPEEVNAALLGFLEEVGG